MRTVTVVLGGSSYEVKELPLRKNAEWRRKLDEALRPAAEALALADKVQLNELAKLADLAPLFGTVRKLLLESPEVLTELLFAYSPELATERARIEDEVYESEIVEAFARVLRLAVPFEPLLRLATSANGAAPKQPETT